MAIVVTLIANILSLFVAFVMLVAWMLPCVAAFFVAGLVLKAIGQLFFGL